MNSNNQKTTDKQYYFFALRIIGDFGASIAVPVVLLTLIGGHFDEKYNSTPLFTIIGFAVAAFISIKIIYKKAKKYGQQYQKMVAPNGKE
ncbi:MAG: AtpZ/AtpI family protein [bacterium]